MIMITCNIHSLDVAQAMQLLRSKQNKMRKNKIENDWETLNKKRFKN